MTCLHGSDEITVVPSLTLRTGAPGQGAWQTGDIKFTSGSTPPTGWLACDGSILAADSPHTALRTFLGSRFALPTDPGGTVRLPDARRAALIGSGGVASAVIGNTVGSRGGKETHMLTVAEMPAHTHPAGTLATSSAGDHRHSLPLTASGHDDHFEEGDGRRLDTGYTGTAGAHTHPITGDVGSTGGGQAHNNMPPSLVVLVLIKT